MISDKIIDQASITGQPAVCSLDLLGFTNYFPQPSIQLPSLDRLSRKGALAYIPVACPDITIIPQR